MPRCQSHHRSVEPLCLGSCPAYWVLMEGMTLLMIWCHTSSMHMQYKDCGCRLHRLGSYKLQRVPHCIRHNDVVVEKVINIYQNWCNQMLWGLFGELPNCRQNPSAVVVSELWIVFTPPTPTWQNSFVASASAVCIGHNSLQFYSTAARSAWAFSSSLPNICTVSGKKRVNSILSITSSDTSQFSKLFYFQNLLEICNKAIIKYPAIPQMRHYITLWNIDARKLACPVHCDSPVTATCTN